MRPKTLLLRILLIAATYAALSAALIHPVGGHKRHQGMLDYARAVIR
jgi:hypothetical protein